VYDLGAGHGFEKLAPTCPASRVLEDAFMSYAGLLRAYSISSCTNSRERRGNREQQVPAGHSAIGWKSRSMS